MPAHPRDLNDLPASNEHARSSRQALTSVTGRDMAEIRGWMNFEEISRGYNVRLEEMASFLEARASCLPLEGGRDGRAPGAGNSPALERS